jgi:hypothetical protein
MTRRWTECVAVVCALMTAITTSSACLPPTVCEDDDVVFPAPRTGEPEWVVSPTAFVRPVSGVATHVWLPWDYNRQPVYPVNEGEPVVFRVRPMVAQSYVGDRARVMVFVEGRLTAVRADEGLESEVHEVPLVDNVGHVSLQVPPSALSPGFNTIQVVVGFHLDGRWAIMTTQKLFTALVGSPSERVYADTPMEDSSSHFRPGYRSELVWTTPSGTESLLLWHRERLPVNPVPVTLRLQMAWPALRDCDEEVRFAVVALLDGRPVPIGGHDRIVATMRWGEQRTLRFDLDLPQDDGPHRYELFYLPSLGRPARRPDGGVPTWVGGVASLAVIQWGTEG